MKLTNLLLVAAILTSPISFVSAATVKTASGRLQVVPLKAPVLKQHFSIQQTGYQPQSTQQLLDDVAAYLNRETSELNAADLAVFADALREAKKEASGSDDRKVINNVYNVVIRIQANL